MDQLGGGKSYDVIDEIKSKDAGLAAAESVNLVKANSGGTNPQKYKAAQNKKSYVNALYPGLTQTATSASADSKTHLYGNVSKVVYRKNGKTIINQ